MPSCVIFNPAARGEKARHFREQLAALSQQTHLKPTYAAGSGRMQAAEAVREGFQTIIAAGGDGTVNEVLNGIRDAGGLPHVRLGVLPLGTINVFARELRIPSAFAAAWGIIEAGRERLIDLPTAEFRRNGTEVCQVFAQLAGAGLDSRAIALVDWEQKKRIGPLAYVVAGFKALAEAKPRIQVNAPQRQTEGQLVLIGNGRLYGGNFELFPQAELTDGRLDVTVFPKVDWEVLLRTGWGWITSQLHTAARCVTFQTEQVELSSAMEDAPVAFEMDGDNFGTLPVRFSVRPQSLRVLAPC
jgi:diacylglycerol kinase (ATP)